MALTDKLTNIADAIREKTGSTRTMNLEGMAAAVTNIKIPTALSDLNEDETHRTVTDAEKKTWNNKSNFSGNYDDLENKPAIPTIPEKLPNPNALTFTGAVEGSYDGSEPVSVEIPQGLSAEWELISDITTEEEVGEVVIENISLKKVFIQATVIGTATNEKTINGHIKINGFTYFYASSLSLSAADGTRFTCSFAEVIGDSKRHHSAALNNNTYQSTVQNTGWFGDGTPINSVVINAASANNRVFGIGSNFKIWGVK